MFYDWPNAFEIYAIYLCTQYMLNDESLPLNICILISDPLAFCQFGVLRKTISRIAAHNAGMNGYLCVCRVAIVLGFGENKKLAKR